MFISYVAVYPKLYETYETYTQRMNEGILNWYQFFYLRIKINILICNNEIIIFNKIIIIIFVMFSTV